jgi:hypothetical protein
MGKLKLIIVLALLMAGCVPVSAAQSLEEETPTPALTGLWIDMSMGPQIVDLFNGMATEQDIARADHVSLVDLLDKVKVGRKLVVFKTITDAEQLLPHMADKLDIIGYNLEHGPSNRPQEQADPVGSVRRMRELADAYGLELALGPDRAFALSHGPAMAPYVDLFVLQVQRAQTDPAAVREFVLPLVAELRRVNPELEISAQVRTEGDVKAIAALVASLEEELDGVSILTSQETVPVAEALVAELRPPLPETAAPQPEVPASLPETTPVKPEAQAAVLETPTAAMRRASGTPAPPPVLAAAPPLTGNGSLALRTLLLFGGLVTLGIVLTGVVATVLIYSTQKPRVR